MNQIPRKDESLRGRLAAARGEQGGVSRTEHPLLITHCHNFRGDAVALLRPVVAVLAWCLLSALPLLAQTNSAVLNRFLLVIETSRAMQHRMVGLEKTVQDLLTSGLGGQIEPGDSLGVWTYNEDLYTGRFQLQRWSEQDRQAIPARVLAFLRAQKYEKQARFDALMPALGLLSEKSDYLTVIVVSTGGNVQGTPFDEAVNRYYRQWRQQQADSQMPFVTVFRAQDGKMAEYSVTAAPWPVELPRVPAALRLARAAPAVSVAATRATSAPVTLPPLILSGKQPSSGPKLTEPATPQPALSTNPPSTVSASVKTSETSVERPAAPVAANSAPVTNALAQTAQSALVARPLADAAPNPAAAVPAKVAAAPAVALTNAPVLQRSEPAVPPTSADVAPKAVSAAGGSAAPVPPNPLQAAVPPALPKSAAADTSPRLAPVPARQTSAPPRVELAAEAQPKPVTPAAKVSGATDAPIARAKAAPPPSGPLPRQASVAPVAATTTAEGSPSHLLVWLGGILVVLAAAGAWWWWVRSRASAPVSLITRSLDRK